jgi:hypothetical protein
MSKASSVDVRTAQIHAELVSIANANGGNLLPAHVVTAARDPNSILHHEFEWDDNEAGHMYRIAQAGALIRRVKLHIVQVGGGAKKVNINVTRAYQSLPSSRKTGKGYDSIEDIMNNPTKRQEMLEGVQKELMAYHKRYSNLIELQDVWDAIELSVTKTATAS